MSLWRDIRRANWRDLGQWRHAAHYLACRMVFGKDCPHIPGIGRGFWDV